MMVGMMIDIGPRFNSETLPALANDPKVKVMDMEALCYSFKQLIFSR